MHRMPALLERGVALMARPGRRIRLPGMLNLLVAGERYRITRKRREHGHCQETSERPEASVHSVIPREPTGMSHDIARSVRLERHESYHHRLLATVTHRQQRKEKLRHNGTKIVSK